MWLAAGILFVCLSKFCVRVTSLSLVIQNQHLIPCQKVCLYYALSVAFDFIILKKMQDSKSFSESCELDDHEEVKYLHKSAVYTFSS